MLLAETALMQAYSANHYRKSLFCIVYEFSLANMNGNAV